MAETEEGLDFESAFKGTFGDPKKTAERLKAERRAGLTPAQRRRSKGPPKTQVNFRATAETKALIDELAEHLGKSTTDVLVLAVEALAAKHPAREATKK